MERSLKQLLYQIWYRCNYIVLIVGLFTVIESRSQSEQHLLELVEKSSAKSHDSIYYELFKLNRLSNPIQAKYYAIKSVDLSVRYGHFSTQVKSHRALAYLYEVLNRIDSSRMLYHRGLKIAVKNNLNDRIPTLYNDLGVLYEKNDIYDSALHYFMLCRELCVESQAYKLQSTTSSNIGLVYSYLENYKEALKYYEEAIAIKIKNDIAEGLNFNFIDVASILNETERYDQATQQLKKVELSCKNGCDDNTLMYLKYGQGYSFFCRGESAQSVASFKEALQLARKTVDNKIIADALYFLALLASKHNKFQEAITYLNEAEKYANRINHRRSLKNIYLELSQVYAKNGGNDKATRYQKLYFELTNNIFNKGVANNVSDIQLSDQRKKSDIVIREKDWALWKAHEFSIILGINVILALTLMVLIYRALRTSWRNKKEMALNMTVMLDENDMRKRELFRVQLEKNELSNRIRSFLNGPVATLAGLSNVFKDVNTPEEFALCVSKMNWLCSNISVVLNNMQELVFHNNLLPNVEEIDVNELMIEINENFKKINSFLLLNIKVQAGHKLKIKTDKALLLVVIDNAIRYFHYANENPVIEILFKQKDSHTIAITVKHYSNDNYDVPHSSRFNCLTAMVIAGQLEGSAFVMQREDHTAFEINLPMILSHSGNPAVSNNNIFSD